MSTELPAAALFDRLSPECGVEKLDSLTASVYKAAVLLTTFQEFGV